MIRRKRYRATCSCRGNSGIITASPAPKLIPKGRYGISVWTQVLLDKFLFFRASRRLIAPMLELLYRAIEQHCQAAAHWHADETGWKVFVKVEEKADYKRTLWVYRSPAAARLPADWEQRYGIRPWLLGSFVDRSRFERTCYRVANWIDVGQVQVPGGALKTSWADDPPDRRANDFSPSRLPLAVAGAGCRRAAIVADLGFVVARVAFRSTLRTVARRPVPAMVR